MAIGDLLRRAKEKVKSADRAKTKEEKAKERVARAVTRVQLERARETLKVAQLERKTREASAQAALERARGEKWEASRSKYRTLLRPPFSSGKSKSGGRKKRGHAIKSLIRGASAVGNFILGPKPKKRSTTKRRVTAKRRTATKRKTRR